MNTTELCDEVDIKTPWFAGVFRGTNAILLLATVALGGLIVYENYKREMEHDQQSCLMKLVIYQHQFPKGEYFDVYTMPQELWQCIPKYLLEQERRKVGLNYAN